MGGKEQEVLAEYHLTCFYYARLLRYEDQWRLLWHLRIQFGHTLFSLSDDKAISITRAQNNFIESAI